MSALSKLAARVARLEHLMDERSAEVEEIARRLPPAPQSAAPAAPVTQADKCDWCGGFGVIPGPGNDHRCPHCDGTGTEPQAALSDAPPATGGGAPMSDVEVLLRAAAIYSINSGHDHRRVFSKMKAMADRLSASTAAAKEGE